MSYYNTKNKVAIKTMATFNQDVNLSKQKGYFYPHSFSLKGSNEPPGDEDSGDKSEIP